MTEQLPPLHVTSKGTIETEGAGLLQVDFANKFVLFFSSSIFVIKKKKK